MKLVAEVDTSKVQDFVRGLSVAREEIAEAALFLADHCNPCEPETDRANCVTGLAGICEKAEACDFVRRHADLLAQNMSGVRA